MKNIGKRCHERSVDQKGVVLCNMYNRCLLENDVPAQWKTSWTVLIHKKGDASDVSNFRLIALMSCIYKNKDNLQLLLDAASSSADLIGPKFLHNKYASLSMTCNKRCKDNIQLNKLKVQGKDIPALKEHEHYRYLGVPIGMICDADSLVDDLCRDLERISSSLLALWKKLDAIRTFVHPCLTFALHAAGFQDSLAKVDIQIVVQVIKMLSSSDPFVSAVAI
ncbi:Hypothetical predicted protein, partial [Paramuricea clavata]